MMRRLKAIRARLGELWWWSAWQFLATRTGDAVNLFVGVWLVPHFVAPGELGAVLPLLQVTGLFGWPLGVLTTTFCKFVNEYQTKGEAGKVKSLILSFGVLSVTTVAVGGVGAAFMMPHFFERIRVTSGSLGMLVLATAVLGTVQPVFVNALMGLKRFRAVTGLNFIAAPVRCLVMAATMPIRALSGYMLGQAAAPAVQIAVACFCLRRSVRAEISASPFWRADGRRMLRYALLTGVGGLGTVVFSMAQVLIIRQRLPEVESAAYYMISRFAEVASYLGATMATFLFPLAVEAKVRGRESLRPLLQTVLASVVFGGVCMLVLGVGGERLLALLPGGAAYGAFVPEMVLLTGALTLGVLSSAFFSYEAANDRFGYAAYACPLSLAAAVFLVAFAGCGYFHGVLPPAAVAWMESFRVATLRNVLTATFVLNLLLVFGMAAQLAWRGQRQKRACLSRCEMVELSHFGQGICTPRKDDAR